jgi:acyl-CoA synthetase (AMP-forming)/AMP-acid ligase II
VLTSLADYLDNGASLGPDEPCVAFGDLTISYREVQEISYDVARSLYRSGINEGDKVGILSSNDPIAYSCIFGIARRGAVWAPINPRNEADENREILDLIDCTCMIFQNAYAPLVAKIAPKLPKLTVLVCLDTDLPWAESFDDWIAAASENPLEEALGRSPDDVAMIFGTGGTTGRSKGVTLTNRNVDMQSALTLIPYPFRGRPVFLAMAPLTHAAAMISFPMLARGGQIVIMPKPDLTRFLQLIPQHRVTHSFLPPTLIYLLMQHEDLPRADFSSMQCLLFGSAPISAARLGEALEKIGPFIGQLFGQSEAPMISMMPPADYFNEDGSIATHRLASAGKPSPLVTLAIMDGDGKLVERGERGEIVLRSSVVMAGYYNNPEATAEAWRHGWHHTGDVGYLDDDGYLYIVDRAKDMIISGGFNVYSAEVEQALMAHPAVGECAVVGLADDKWGERVTAVVVPRPGADLDTGDVIAFVKGRIGSVKAPKQVEVWSDLPRSKLGKILKADVRARLNAAAS